MLIKKFVKIFLLFLIVSTSTYFIYLKIFDDKEIVIENKGNELSLNSNILKDVKYITRDKAGNEYLIKAALGEIDLSNPNTIYLTDVYSLIKLNNSREVSIISNYGKYNSINMDTIFSKNVEIIYLDNKITGEYLDFSLERNSMIISKNVIYSNINTTINADVVEIDIKSKDTKIFMYNEKKKVKIKNKTLK